MKIEYGSNNSGGSWWLEDKHWLALERAGWKPIWGGKSYCHSDFNSAFMRGGKAPEPPNTCPKEECEGHQNAKSLEEAKALKLKWLGCYASEAVGEFDSLADAIRSWESATGMDASDEGCNCCGAPHSFSIVDRPEGMAWEDGYVSGDRIVDVLYPGAPKSRRAAAEKESKRR